MKFAIWTTKDARSDIRAIYRYILEKDGLGRAENFLQQIEKATDSLQEMPERGVIPLEMSFFGIMDFREIFFKPYRLVYSVAESTVYIHVVADGRRDMSTLLKKRLLR